MVDGTLKITGFLEVSELSSGHDAVLSEQDPQIPRTPCSHTARPSPEMLLTTARVSVICF
jgi:hypothetical protein